MTEVWKPVLGVIGFEASSHGRIRTASGRILIPSKCKKRTDYPRVRISNKRLGGPYADRFFTVHSLVSRAFIGPRPDGMEHNHKDGNKENPRPENLEFVTRKENQQHSIHVLGKPTGRAGTQHGMSKFTDDTMREIHQMRKSGHCLREIAARFQCAVSTISQVCRGRTWKHLQLPDLGDHRH